MSDDDKTDEEKAAEAAAKAEKAAAKKEPKRIKVRVLRAVDAYHHKLVLDVPNDEYHRALLKQGNLKAVD